MRAILFARSGVQPSLRFASCFRSAFFFTLGTAMRLGTGFDLCDAFLKFLLIDFLKKVTIRTIPQVLTDFPPP